MPALHIALATETYPPEINGVAMTLGRLVDGLRARGLRVSLTRPRQSNEYVAAPDDTQRVTGVPIPGYAGLKFGVASTRQLAEAWRRSRPDLVHIATEGPLGWSAMTAANRLGLPVVASYHTNFHHYSRHYGLGWLQRPVHAYLRRFHNRAALTLVPTQRLCDQLAAAGYRNLGVMARGVDTVRFHPQRRDPGLRQAWGAAAHDPVVLHVGRLAPEKNLPLAIAAFRVMQAVQPRARLVMVGDGPAYRRTRQAHPDLILAGTRVGEDLARHYASADCFLFPSLTETFGNVVLEAMASGLAVLAFDYAAAAEHVQSGVNGMTAAYGDEAAFLRLATELVASPERRRRLGQAAHASVQDLAWTRVLDALLADYRRLIAAPPAGAVAPASSVRR